MTPPKKTAACPQHVAIIMDGNGRWARARGLPRIAGHKQGVENVRRIVRAASKRNIKYLTLYAFSVENWQRPKAEIAALMRLLSSFLRTGLKDLIENRIRLRVIGDISELPILQRTLLNRALKRTEKFDERHLVLALNYAARTETLAAVAAYAADVKKGKAPARPQWADFAKYLSTADIPDPDLIIRTSGECRLSNFLLLQAAYAEMYFSPVLWPDFDEACFDAALEDYAKRERRFGLTGEQISNG